MLLRFGLLAGLCLVLVLGEDEEVIKCPGGICVKLHLCPNGELNTDGANIIDIRFNPDNECEDYLLKCCPTPEDDEDEVDEPATSGPIGLPDTVTKPSVAPGTDPVPGTVPSHPSSIPQGPGSTVGPGNTAGAKPLPGSLAGDGGGGGGGGGGGNKGHHGCSENGGCHRPPPVGGGNDEQVEMVGGEIIPTHGQVAANQVKENNVPQPQGGGPPVKEAGSTGGTGTVNSKPGGDIPPTGLGLKPTGSTNLPSGGGADTGPGGAGAKQPGQSGDGVTGPSSPSATGTGATQPGQSGAGVTGPSSPPATEPGAKQPGQSGAGGTGPGATQPSQPGSVSTGPSSPSATGPGPSGAGGTGPSAPSATGPGAKQPGQSGAGGTGPSAPSATGPGTTQPSQSGAEVTGPSSPSATGSGAKQPGQSGTGGTGPSSPSATGPGAKQPGQSGAEVTGPSSPSATGSGAKQPGQSGTGGTGPSSPSATGSGAKQPGQSGTGGTAPSPNVIGQPSSGGTKHPTASDTKPTQPKGDGTNTKGQLITTERPINVPQKCGVRNADGVGFRITGDNDGESEYGEFPWMVAILKEEKALDQVINVYQCGGSLIHPSVVLTAAHCVQNRQPGEMKVRLGEWDTQTKNEIFDYQDRNVVEIVTHAEFYKGGLFNDVALLFLDRPAELMDTVSTICLPPADYNFDLSRCFASGWGKDVFGKQGTYQVILKKIELPVMDRDNCQKALRKTRLGSRFKLHKSFICAGGEKGRDTCRGDGGSPLVCPIPGTVNEYYQAGMVAWGIGCGEDGVPGVYVNVPLFRGWIDEHLTQRNIPHNYYLRE